MSDTIISVKNLGKAYRIGLKEEIPDTIVGALQSWIKAPLTNFTKLRRLNTFSDNGNGDDIIWALKDVSFEVKQGEVVGIIGRNGAGKSTLLKILSRITEPTTGRAVIHGRVSSLLEVGTGFHPELTGRENVYMNGTILGMRKKEIDRKFDEIVDFSGVEKFLDTPIKRYSSGMNVRLAFAVAAHLDPEILIIDEVLAVGDFEFQKKCLGKMQDVARSGRTVLFVSHNMGAVNSLCSKAIVLNSGMIQTMGDTQRVIRLYLKDDEVTTIGDVDLLQHTGRRRSARPIFQRIRMTNDRGDISNTFVSGECIHFQLDLLTTEEIKAPKVHIGVTDAMGVRLFTLSTDLSDIVLSQLMGPVTLFCDLHRVPLNRGTYFLVLGVASNRGNEWFDAIDKATSFEIVFNNTSLREGTIKRTHGPLLLDADWHLMKNHHTSRIASETGFHT